MRWHSGASFLLLLTTPVGCASAPPAAPTPLAAATPEEDVEVLKERVARMERRLADVDAKLGLLLAQKASRTPRAPVAISSDDAVTRNLGPRELIVEEAPREEASLGARAGGRSVDLGPRGRPSADEPDELEGARQDNLVDAAGDNGEAVVIRMTGDERGSVAQGPPEGATVEQLYQWGQDRLKAGQTLEAVHAFEEVEQRHPGHDLADNAAYWIGWAHQSRGDHRLALQVWERLPLKYPKSAKVSDALFGMAVSHEALGEPAVAETLYEQLTRRFPKAEKVREAQRALARLRPR